VTAARSAAVAALGVIVAFHRAEQPLMTQVGYGIGDISTAEKRKLAAGTGVTPPRWPDSAWGRVAAAAWNGRCEVFTDFLRPVLRACAESVTQLAEPNITESASRLSDVTFRTCLADREGPVDLLARGLTALWFERDLARLAGALPRDLESAETALAAVARRRTDPRAEANANAVVVRVLLEAGTLHRRCVGEAQRTVALWQNLAADLDGPVSDATGHDLQRLSDAASHLGLAAARFGDRRTAADAWQLSRRVADQGLGHDQSRIARADTNLAALAAETGHGEQAGIAVAGVHRTRLALLDRGPQDAAAWRRLTVTERTRADVARLSGAAAESVRLAIALLADRRARLGDPAHADTAEAQIILGQTLLAAGHPAAARRHLRRPPTPGAAGSCSPRTGSRKISSGWPRRLSCSGTPGPCSTCSPGRRRRPTGSATRCRSGSATPPGGWPRWPVASSVRPGRQATTCSPPGRNWPAGRWTRGLTRSPRTSTGPSPSWR
jgi:hypothetical protein